MNGDGNQNKARIENAPSHNRNGWERMMSRLRRFLCTQNKAFVSWKDRKAILPAIKAIYRAESADMAMVRLEEFEAEWGKRYPAIGQTWRRAWEHVIPFFPFAPGIRKMIYTTNAVEALHRSLRKIIKTRGSFPTDDAALKLLYLAIKNAGLRTQGAHHGRH
jgi:putative transposase